jgi:hypothetical protein
MKEKFGNNVNKLLEVSLAVPSSRLTKKQAGRVQNGQIFLPLCKIGQFLKFHKGCAAAAVGAAELVL